MDGTSRHYAKLYKSDKDKYYMISLICRICKSQTHTNRVEWQLVGDKSGKIQEIFFKGTILQLGDK